MDIDVDEVCRVILLELEPELRKRYAEMEAAIMQRTVAFQHEIRAEVRRDHAENRTRLQGVDRMATRAVAQNTMIMEQQKEQLKTSKGVQAQVTELLLEIRGASGKAEGMAVAKAEQVAVDQKKSEERAKLVKYLQAAFGVLTSAGIGKWLMDHFHLHK